jgi:1-acyl-sn-glycerol-3-phosphate acyltransferase
MTSGDLPTPYPRRRIVRTVLKGLINAAFKSLSEIEVVGQENLPKSGPLLVVGNHFSFLDPVAVIHIMPWQLEFIGGAQAPNAPAAVGWIRNIWQTLPVRRGTASRETLIKAQEVLNQGGVLGIFPEGGSWASVLRPARPGAAFLAARTGAPILPIGLDGFTTFFNRVRRGKRAHARVHIGKIFGPFNLDARNRADRTRLENVGREIMEHIAELLPEERRGFFSSNPAIRAAALGSEIYPWENVIEE